MQEGLVMLFRDNQQVMFMIWSQRIRHVGRLILNEFSVVGSAKRTAACRETANIIRIFHTVSLDLYPFGEPHPRHDFLIHDTRITTIAKS